MIEQIASLDEIKEAGTSKATIDRVLSGLRTRTKEALEKGKGFLWVGFLSIGRVRRKASTRMVPRPGMTGHESRRQIRIEARDTARIRAGKPLQNAANTQFLKRQEAQLSRKAGKPSAPSPKMAAQKPAPAKAARKPAPATTAKGAGKPAKQQAAAPQMPPPKPAAKRQPAARGAQ
jgi:nucleoid DNA-binding protein